MRAYDRIKTLEALTGKKKGNYKVNYVYDTQGRIEQEIVTGVMERTTVFHYNVNDDIYREVITQGEETITKIYNYDPVTKNITDIDVTIV